MSEQQKVTVELSHAAAHFLHGTIAYLNNARNLPTDDLEALEAAGWMEEIAASTREAIEATGCRCAQEPSL